MSDSIPFLDLVTPHRELEPELVELFREALHTGRFIGGPNVEIFESDFAEYCRSRQCVGVGSGTDALRFALMAAGIGQGETVLTVPNTFVATTEAITQAGGIPDFIDIDPTTFNMDPDLLRDYLENQCELRRGRLFSLRTGRYVSAVVPVHLYGQVADMDPILSLARSYDLIVVEDACQAHGAEYFSREQNKWRRAGSLGDAAAFSFYPGKNLGACGEGGAVTTDDASLAHAVRMFRDHGQASKYYHDFEGYNGRLDAIQAGILRVKLRKLSEWNSQRRACAKIYNQLLEDVADIQIPQEPEWSRSVYHLYVIQLADRDRTVDYLKSRGIGVGLHYPLPIHLQKAYSHLGYRKNDFPVTERVAANLLSLPLFPGLTPEQQRRVAEELRSFINTRSSSKVVRAVQ